jgi:hypothetical protein
MAKRPTSFMFTGFFKELPQTIQAYFEQLEYQEKKAALNVLNKMVTDSDLDTSITAFSLSLTATISGNFRMLRKEKFDYHNKS